LKLAIFKGGSNKQMVIFYNKLFRVCEIRQKNRVLFPSSLTDLDDYAHLIVSLRTSLLYNSSTTHVLRCKASGSLAGYYPEFTNDINLLRWPFFSEN
jgi:hypothetical protein